MSNKWRNAQKRNSKSSITYAETGVDIQRATLAKSHIKKLARKTFTPGVLSDIGLFGALFRPDFSKLKIPILVSSVDGVGTKLKIAFMTGIHNTVGIDLVSHCVNDIVVQGALPMFFMDYIAAGRLDTDIIADVVKGLSTACEESQCALLGGETAEMPDFYSDGEYDLAGFIVGLADEHKLLGSNNVKEGDFLIGLPSSGLHTNGFSLVRKLFFEMGKFKPDKHIEELGRSLGEELLEPHRNYLPVLRELMQTDNLRAIAHITGGGIPGNLDRVLPPKLDAIVEEGSWEVLPIFKVIQSLGQIAQLEMYKTFNMGLGIILIVSPQRVDLVQEYLQSKDETYYLIGEVGQGNQKVSFK